jgi:saccharopine dehydrogenase (NAD+, L-lysine forming)
MKVLILGYGFVGSVLSKLLAKEKSISEIICGDIKIKEEARDEKILFKKVDASDNNELLELLEKEKPDLLVNLLIPLFNTAVMNCCLLRKINYIDTASNWESDSSPNPPSPYKIEQLDFFKEFKDNKIIGLINSGVSPGLTNLLAKEASEQLDKINSIKIRIIEDTRSEKLYFPWCIEWLIDEMNYEPLVYENKQFKKVKRFSGIENFSFPEPFGKKKICFISQEEVGTIPLNIDVRNVDIKAHDNQGDVAKFLVKLGLASDKKIRVDNIEISPRRFLSKLLSDEKKLIPEKWEIKNAQFGMVVIAEGRKDKKKKKIVYFSSFPEENEIDKLELNANFISYPTALSLKTFIMMFPEIKKFGIFPPETLDKSIRTKIIDNLKNESITIEKLE